MKLFAGNGTCSPSINSMKNALLSLLFLVSAGSTFAGQRVVAVDRADTSFESQCSRTRKVTNAGTPGAYYRSNFFHNAVLLINESSDYMTFFVYSGAVCGPNDINKMIRVGAHVYEIVVPPHSRSFTDERGRHYWVGSKRGKWGVDLSTNRVVPLTW